MTEIAVPFGLTPDSRMKLFIAGLDDRGKPIPLTPATLRANADSWPTCPSTPNEISGLLQTSRDLYVCSYFAYEFLTIGVLVSLQAVEAGLRSRLSVKANFATLAQAARAEGVITDDQYQQLDAGRRLRNEFSHPAEQVVWTYGMAAPSIEGAHRIVAELFA